MFFNDLTDLKKQYQEMIKDRLKKIYYFLLNLFNEYNNDNFKFKENISGAEEKLFKNITSLVFFYKNIVNINEDTFSYINDFKSNSLNNFQQNSYDKIIIVGNDEDINIFKKEIKEINNDLIFETNSINVFDNYWFYILKNTLKIKYLIDFSTKQFSKFSINFFLDANNLNNINEIDSEKILLQYNYFFNVLFNERIIKWFNQSDENYSFEFSKQQENKIDNLFSSIENNSLLIFLNLNDKKKYFEFSFFNLLKLYLKILSVKNLSVFVYGSLEKINTTLISLLITNNIIDKNEFKYILNSKSITEHKTKNDYMSLKINSLDTFNTIIDNENDNLNKTFDLNNRKNEDDDLIETIDLDSFNSEIFSSDYTNKINTLDSNLNEKTLNNEVELIKISTYFEYFMDQFISQKNNWTIDNEIFDEQKLLHFKSSVSLMNIRETYIFLKNNTSIIFSKIYNSKIDKLFELRINYLFNHVKAKYKICQDYLNKNRGNKYAK